MRRHVPCLVRGEAVVELDPDQPCVSEQHCASDTIRSQATAGGRRSSRVRAKTHEQLLPDSHGACRISDDCDVAAIISSRSRELYTGVSTTLSFYL